MKTETLKELGLTDEQIKAVMKENGKDIKELQDNLAKVEKDRDTYKAKAETAEETLKNFDGIDPEKISKEVEEWKAKAEKMEQEYKADLAKRDYEDALKVAIDGVEFTSESAKKSIMADIRNAGLKVSNGKLLGFNDLLDQLKESDKSAFVDKDQQKLEDNKAKFTTKNTGENGNKLTKEDIMKVSDRTERRRLMSENMDLFE